MGLQTFIKDAYQQFSAGISERQLKRRLNNQIIHDIKEFMKEHCPAMSLNAGYRKKLIKSINYSFAHISGLVDQIPGPVELDPKHWEDQPVLHSIFLNPEEISARLQSSSELKSIFKNSNTTQAIALLTAIMHRKTVLGIEKTGEILRRDVPQETIYFDDHQILAAAANISDSRFKFKHLALNSICSQIFKETTEMKGWKKELEEQQALLEFKLSSETPSDTQSDIKETKQLLSDISNRIADLNNQTNVTGEHLERVTQVFENPLQHLSLTTENLKLDNLGIQLDTASTDRADEFSIAEFQFGQTPKRAAIWVLVKRSFIP